MKQWQPGDPIASGELHFPDAESRQAYGNAVRAAFIESYAMTALNIKTRRGRQIMLDLVPLPLREQVKARLLELWQKRA